MSLDYFAPFAVTAWLIERTVIGVNYRFFARGLEAFAAVACHADLIASASTALSALASRTLVEPWRPQAPPAIPERSTLGATAA